MRRISWAFHDPKGLPPGQVRPTRDEIEHAVEQLARDFDVSAGPPVKKRGTLRVILIGMEANPERSSLLAEIELTYRTRLAELLRVAAAISGSREAAPDLVQEAFVRAVRRAESFRGEGPVDGWLWRIVVNVSLNHHRQRETVPVPAELPTALTPAAGASEPEVAAAIARLSERQRVILFLRYYADLDYRTIAAALAISTGTVGATLTTARAALAQALDLKEATL